MDTSFALDEAEPGTHWAGEPGEEVLTIIGTK
jgi:hypothetical protein